ncbi:MAG: gamma carbonic anhydrase family protein [Pseudomonadota bacterium]
MTLYALNGRRPSLPDAPWFAAPNAQVIGDVVIGPEVSIWFGAVLRGDNEPITLGRGTNVQDNCVFHTDPGFPMTLGEDVTVGHSAILHGCSVDDGSLIGMGAIVLNGARIGKGCLIGAKALVTEGKEIPDGSMVLGAPGKIARVLAPEQQEGLRRAADIYREKLGRYRTGLTPIG